MNVEAGYRLPRSVIPSHYDLHLAPDLDNATFAGRAAITVAVVEPVTDIILNAVDLQVTSAAVRSIAGELVVETISYDAANERVVLRFPGEIPPGAGTLDISFTGILNDDLQGFYRSTYKDDAGTEHVIASTQFEATDARRAFPCWDEPDLKATFTVALEVADGLVAVANAAVVAAEPTDRGTVIHRFAETMKMSTYLVAFVVGDFEISGPIDVGDVPLRVLHRPGKGNLADFALEVGAFALDYFTEYYDILYPGDKLDMIAIPDFAWGAMENLGAITFRETALLIDRHRATQEELVRVADVIAHEIAHMWFGDLVTMKWWNGIWLNEAFATFMELKCVDAFRPEWKRWLSFAHFRSQSMDIDGLSSTRPVEYPVASPEEANAMFDTLTYGKGSAVLRMLEQYLGEEVFRRGISRYLKAHAYGNTETADLWAALEAESGEPVGDIMSGWIYQGGYPQLDVAAVPEGYRITQRQFRFRGEGKSVWQVPARYGAGSATDGIVVGTAGADLPTPSPAVVLNSGGDGFYRVNYPAEQLAGLAAELGLLAPAERYTLIADTWANVLSGDKAASEFIGLLAAWGDEEEPDVWGVAVGGIAELDRVISSDDRSVLQQWIRDLVGGQVARLGWDAAAGDSDLRRRLRALMLRTAGNLGDDPHVQETAQDVLDRLLVDTASADANVADAAVGIVAANGNAADFTRFLELRARATSPQDEVRYLRAAAAVPEQETAVRLVEMVLAGEIRRQDAPWVLARLLGHRDTGASVWEKIKSRWDDVLGSMPPQSRRRMLDLIMYRSEPEIAGDIEEWLQRHPIPGAEHATAQQLERLRIRVGLREREGERLGDALS